MPKEPIKECGYVRRCGSAKCQLDQMNNHHMTCMREKPTIVPNPLQQLSLDSSDHAEKLGTGRFGGRC